MKPNLKDVTLVCIDCTRKVFLGHRAVQKSMEQCDFGAIKFLTDKIGFPNSVPMGTVSDMAGYSNFCIRELHKHVDTTHCLLVQHDGYVLNGGAWEDEFLKHDYIGAPWGGVNLVGNGGFSLRSKRLLEACSKMSGDPHPEDDFICRRNRAGLESMGISFAPKPMADRFAVEGASFVWKDYAWNSDGRFWSGQFGFHSYLTPLSNLKDRPLIFHHSGDLGDIIYSLPVLKVLGGGVLYLSSDCRYPFPKPPRTVMTHPVANLITPFLEQQPYVWQCKYTPNLPFSTDVDLNTFRDYYRTHKPDRVKSLFQLHLAPFGLSHPEDKPWLFIDQVTRVPGRPIAVNLTPRYRNPHFPWLHLIRQYSEQMVFVGLEEEAKEFNRMCAAVGRAVPWCRTANLMELARVVAGSKVFIGNQSTPMALALGFGKNVIQECWQGNANCLFNRSNAIFWGVSTVDPEIAIPDDWLTMKKNL
jgi:hypothetical protein